MADLNFNGKPNIKDLSGGTKFAFETKAGGVPYATLQEAHDATPYRHLDDKRYISASNSLGYIIYTYVGKTAADNANISNLKIFLYSKEEVDTLLAAINLRIDSVIASIPQSPIGAFYSENNFTNLSDFTAADNYTVSGGKIIAAPDPGFTKKLYLNNITALNDIYFKAEFKVTDTTGYGLVLGFESVNNTPSQQGFFGAYLVTSSSNSTFVGKINHTSKGNDNGGNGYVTGTAISVNVGDILRHEIIITERVVNAATTLVTRIVVTNLTTPGTTSYEVTNSFVRNQTQDDLLSNTSKVYLQNIGIGSFEINSIELGTTYLQNRRMAVGDSLTQRFYAEVWGNGWASLINAQSQSGGGDKTREVLLRLPELIASKPKQVILLIGTNDNGTGVSLSTFQTNHQSIVSQLETAGIPVLVVSPPSIPSYDTWMASTYTGKFVSGYTILKDPNGTGLNPSYDSGDGVHMNIAGNAALANGITASGLLL